MKKREYYEEILKKSDDRFDLWGHFIADNGLKNIAEVGVYKGDFAARILKGYSEIEKYYMIDPWRNLSSWNKPANRDNQVFEAFYQEAMHKTEFAKDKIEVLKGKTTEVIQEIPDESLDFVYIDGDHTLKGITIDLINIWDKIKPGGFIAGDDFCPTIWQHSLKFEPTLVFPFAAYFAEAKGVRIIGLPFNQFLICKEQEGYDFLDLTDDSYKNRTLLSHLSKTTILKKVIKTFMP